jgi:hypothetical protein
VAKKRRTKRHVVQADFRVPQLAKAGSSLSLKLYAQDRKIGEIIIGRGSLYWSGARRHRRRRKRVSWTNFAEMMDGLAYGE